MNKKNNIIRKKIKTNYIKRKLSKKIKNKNTFTKPWNIFIKFILYLIILFIILWSFIGFILYKKYIVWLPNIEDLENIKILESSIIYDKDWGELYKIFKEKRTYVWFENISKNMINAIVSIEDKRYWENPWVDIKWIVRAWINYIIWNNNSVKWTSTITQQLIRNTIIKNERSLERKIKEIYLAYKLTSWISKEKILELYLNKISYWHNAFGIEEAAKTFFNKSSKNIWILESSILASLPKWPTAYSPYNHQDRVIWYPYIYNKNDNKNYKKIITNKDIQSNEILINKFIKFLLSIKATRLWNTDKILICNIKKQYFKNPIRVDKDWCNIIKYSKIISFLNDIKINFKEQYIEYEAGRKDRVLWRMLEDNYINFEEYKKAIIDSIWMKFSKSKEKINSPHFVFYVKEYLENKFWKEIVSVWWLKIYTTLDSKLQKKAEELIKNKSEINEIKFSAKNAALISLDNEKWEILSMVWWRDYFDLENKWNVNIINSKLQPWSAFKPFVYALWILNQEIWTKTPIYDVETEFSKDYIPANFDWKFLWKMNISTALNNSRNIPALKMFYLANWEKNIISFMKKLWVKSLKNNFWYWAPLALWTWEMTPLELAIAYSIFANMWIKKDFTPILKIIDSKWNIIEEKKEIQENKKTIISKSLAYIINKILSDPSSRPNFWNNYLTLNGRIVSAKTWTSTKQYIKNKEKDIYPVNLWTIWYTPQITTVVWVWNTTWEKLNYKWNWLEWAGPIWRDFMNFAHIWKPIKIWNKPSWIFNINISEMSWLLANPNKSDGVNSLFLNKPNKQDKNYTQIKVDSLCNWIITHKTPLSAIKTINLLKLNSLSPNNPKWQDPVNQWAKSTEFKEKYWYIPNITTKISSLECIRSGIKSEIKINTEIKNNDNLYIWENFIKIAYKSINPIIKINVYIWNTLIQEIKVANKIKSLFTWKIFIPASKRWKNKAITIEAIDNEHFTKKITKKINILNK